MASSTSFPSPSPSPSPSPLFSLLLFLLSWNGDQRPAEQATSLISTKTDKQLFVVVGCRLSVVVVAATKAANKQLEKCCL